MADDTGGFTVEKPDTGGFSVAPPTKGADKDAPRWDILGDIGKAASESAGALKEDFSNAFSIDRDKAAQQEGLVPELKREAGKFGSALKVPLDVMGLVASPLTGAARALGGSALSYLPGVSKKQADEGVDTAMLGLAPKTGLKPPAIAPRLPPGVRPPAMPAIDAGYVLPPAVVQEKPGALNSVLSGEAGKTKLFQKASEKNQAVTDSLAARGLGLPADAPVTRGELQRIRADAGKAYDAIPAALPQVDLSDTLFQGVIGQLGGRATGAAAAFPTLMKNPAIDTLVEAFKAGGAHATEDVIFTIRKLRRDSGMNFKARDNPEKAELAFAQREAADALDATIERGLLAKGQPDLATQYRTARMTIAKTHDVEAALLPTGSVSAGRIAALQRKGVPLSGELKTIADTYDNFEGALQNPSKHGTTEDYSILDIIVGGTSAAAGHPGMAAAIVARPFVRNYLLSQRHQQNMLRPPRTPGGTAMRFTSAGGIQDAINPPLLP